MSSSAAEEEGRKQVLVTAVVGFEESMGEKNGEDGRRFLKKKRENEKPFQVFINGFSFFFSSFSCIFFYFVSGVACHLQLRLDRFVLYAKQDLSTEVEFPLLLGFL